MGWVWTGDEAASDGSSSSSYSDASDFRISSSSSGERCSTRKVVKTQCRTEEVEPGKFMRKCQKTEEIFKDCVGSPTELVQSNKEYTEEDVTGQMAKGALSLDNSEDINFPGLNRDIEAIGRSLFGTISRAFEAAEEIKNGFFNVFGDPVTPHINGGDSSSAAKSRGFPIEVPQKEVPSGPSKSDGDVDLSGLARDI
ncbi:uncharacterized protein LOC113775297 [Coffea eugenioides]|uniref:uncharacterized protein LOC113775297 n=1 Tax=Coffea eugenioides TaxID=49369 RepID=UPI000F60CF1A|nr:uncharacterized protein LOC113775297 [Coffea eugenioides]